jgi:DNA-binding winged helix-turn-helix (wHTH) protein/tetratricopeptide (TPR) repeat protein
LLDPATREVRRDGELLSLSPKVFDCIVYLLAHRERAVGHDELASAVWGKADVTDVELRQLVRNVRRVVGGDGDHQSTIRTVAHFGFHWVAETIEESAALPMARNELERREPVDAAPVPLRSSAVVRSGRGGRAAAYALLALAVLFVGAFAWTRVRNDSGQFETALIGQASGAIGVLPAEIDSRDDADETWMRLGLMDFVAGRLRKAEVRTVATSDIVALSRDTASRELPARVQRVTRAAAILISSATRTQSGWRVRLALRGSNGNERAAEADSADALIAAREATDRLLVLLGKGGPSVLPDDTAPSTAELAQRVESALLVNDYATARRLIESSPPAVRDLPEMQLDLARIDSALDKDAPARERLDAILLRVSAKDDPVLHARALTSLGWLDSLNTEISLREYSEAVDLLAATNEPIHLGAAYLGRAVTHSLARHFDAAKADYAQARVMFALANDSLRLADVDDDEAALDSDFGRPADALPLFERAAATMERFGAIDKMITPVCNQVIARLELLQPGEALAVYREARPKVAGAGSQESLHFLDYLGAVSLAGNGHLTESRALAASVSAAAGAKDEAGLRALIGGFLAELDFSDGKIDTAVSLASKSVAELSELGRFRLGQADAWLTLTRALRVAGKSAEAESQTQAFAKSMNGTAPAASLRARVAQAEQYWTRGQRPLALQTYEEATQAAERGGVPQEIRVIAASYGMALLDAGELASASAVIGRVGRWAARDYESALLQARLYRALGQSDAGRLSLNSARALAGERSIPADVSARRR